MTEESLDTPPNKRQWVGFWCMIAQQAQNAFSDKMAQFTLIPLGGALAFTLLIPLGSGVELDVPSLAGLMMALPMILFAPLTGWVSDRFSKRNVMLVTSCIQALVLAGICGAVVIKNMPLALCGFFALAVQAAFFSPAKIGINKELVGSSHLGFAAGIQQMTSMLAILTGEIFAGWLFAQHFTGHSNEITAAWNAALVPLFILTLSTLLAVLLGFFVPKVSPQGETKFTPKLLVSHFINLADLWRDVPLRRASFGVAFFWGFAAFINLWSIKLAKMLTGGGEGFGTMSSVFMAATSLGMAAGFGLASYLLRKRIDLGWVPAAGMAMTITALALAFMTPSGWLFLITLGLLGFCSAIFLTPLTAWMQDRYPANKRGKLQSTVNLQNCIAGMIAVVLISIFDLGTKACGISVSNSFKIELIFMSITCGLMSLLVLRLLPGDFIRLVGGAIVRWIYHIRVAHPDRIPLTGGALLLPNHLTFADGLFISAACARPVRFVMDETFMARRSIRFFSRILNTVTIRRDQPREAIRITIEALKNGDLVCMFPEGQLSRTGTLNELRRGFELIAKKAGHPLIPIWCDGSWESIFSFERGRFISKYPYRSRSGITIAMGMPIDPEDADLESLRAGLLAASTDAVSEAFDAPVWKSRIPKGHGDTIQKFRELSALERQRFWTNGHQIGQINALQRRQSFGELNDELTQLGLLSLRLTFPELFKAACSSRSTIAGNPPTAWVGGDELRKEIGHTQLNATLIFYDFGSLALDPIYQEKLFHYPCLAIRGIVIAMSMPDPPCPQVTSEKQLGHKLGTWGRLLPGWQILSSENGEIRAHGPAAPPDGLPLPPHSFLDAEGFLTAGK